MDEKKFNTILNTYRSGVDFTLEYYRKRKDSVTREVRLISLNGQEPYFIFLDSKDRFYPDSIGGFEKIIVLDVKDDSNNS